MPLAQDLGRLDAPDFGGVHARPGLAQRIVGVDRPTGILDHEGFEALAA